MNKEVGYQALDAFKDIATCRLTWLGPQLKSYIHPTDILKLRKLRHFTIDISMVQLGFEWDVPCQFGDLLRKIVTENTHTPQESGGNLAYVALNSKEKDVIGKYYEGRKMIDSSVDSYVEEKQEDLWAWTIKTVARDEQERQKFESLQ